MDTSNRKIFTVGSLAGLAVLFISLVILSETLFSGFKLDLTSNKQYTLSQGTRNILADMSEPVNLYLFFSEESSRELPQIRRHAQWVSELLEEMSDISNGKLKFERVDPQPFSTDEDRAAQFGLQGVPVGATGDTLYFGLVGTNSIDDVQAMPFLQPTKEQFLEYDVAKMLSSLTRPERKKVGLLTSLEMQPGYDPARQAMREAWTIYTQLDQTFDLVEVDGESAQLPPDLDLLVLVHPRNLSESMSYALDQYVLGGGRLVAFLDPFAESDMGGNPADPMAAMNANSSSTLGPLLDAWGVTFSTEQFVGDVLYAMQVGMGAGAPPVRHVGIMSVSRDSINQEDIASADLETVNWSTSGWLEASADATTSFSPLVTTSENAAPIDTQRMRTLSNPTQLLSDFQSTGDRYALAARVTGPSVSAFDAAPDGVEGTHLRNSVEQGIQILLFADTDMLTDRFWVQKQNFLGQVLVNSFADNGNLVINAVDHLLGSADLISVRTRNTLARPFDRVEALRMEAEGRFRATEERLQRELDEAEMKLVEMQSTRSEGDLTILSEAQSDEIQRFINQRAQIRSDLRAVRHDLDREIDALGTRLKLINIALMPALVALAALMYTSVRRRRREGVQS